MGRWNPEHKCVEALVVSKSYVELAVLVLGTLRRQLPCSNPVVCIGYDGYIEPGRAQPTEIQSLSLREAILLAGIWSPPAPPPPSPHGWGRRWGWRRWLLLQNESLGEDFDESGHVLR